ncbi:MAG: N-acetylmuramoyl-L-alanine amidase [Muribaculaceae bacterium]|nr:N-acetylmuramoyl-L-alanine amidase [Muribaculaceae bacterium]
MGFRNFLFLAALISAIAAPAQMRLEVLKQSHIGDKVRLVGITDPGASITINGKAVHVYNSGTFGYESPLNEGNNDFKITASKNKSTKTITVTEHHPAPKPEEKETEAIAPQPITPTLVRTLEGAYLQYGVAGDRLGGSKMGYLDSGVTLQATEEYGDLYRVNLSGHRDAYIPMKFTEPVGEGTLEQVASGSVSISNRGKCDRVFVRLPKRVAYRSFTSLDPSTITVEIFSVRNNSNWITHKQGLDMVDYVDVVQTEADVMQVVIHLKQKHNWGYTVHYDKSGLAIEVKHVPSLKLADMTIGLDAGHGGSYPGSLGYTGLTEKEINLALIKLVKERLEKRGAKVDLAISIHNNSGGSPLMEMGSSTYYKHMFCMPLARVMRKHLLSLGFKDFGMTGNFNFSLSQPTDYPSVLLEVLFMSSLADEEKLLDPKWRRRIADSVVAGLEEYLDEAKKDK